VIEWIITSSGLIVAIILLRFLFRKKISRRLQYALWIPVLLRLLLPFTFGESALSIMNWTELQKSNAITHISNPSNMPEYLPGQPLNDATHAHNETRTQTNGKIDTGKTLGPTFTIGKVLSVAWMLGSCVIGLLFIGVNTAFYMKLRRSRKPYLASLSEMKDTEVNYINNCRRPLYVTEEIISPCLFGFPYPSIYLTPKAVSTEVKTEYIITHELCHLKNGDHMWSVLRGICLVIWWWNPLVWISAVLSQIDSELACDEASIKHIGENSRFSYGRTLIDMIAVRRTIGGLMGTATTMVSGKQNMKERINMIVKKPKTYISAVIAVLIITIICVGCTFTGAEKHVSPDDTETGIVMEGVDVPGDVLEAAKLEVEQLFKIYCEDYPHYGYVDWRIENLNYSYTYEDLDGMRLVIYQMNYELLSKSPENVVLAGGMYITEDNWVMPNYRNCTYLIFRQDGDTLKFLNSMMENDCTPGTELFTDDLRRILSRIENYEHSSFSEYSVFVDGKYLALGVYDGDFPWGYSLTEISREKWDSDGFRNINKVICDDLIVTYMQASEEGRWSVTYIATTSPKIMTYRGITCGMSETELKNAYGDDLVYSEMYADDNNPVAEYDYVYGYAPARDNTCNHIAFLIKDGVICGIEIKNLIDGRLFQ